MPPPALSQAFPAPREEPPGTTTLNSIRTVLEPDRQLGKQGPPKEQPVHSIGHPHTKLLSESQEETAAEGTTLPLKVSEPSETDVLETPGASVISGKHHLGLGSWSEAPLGWSTSKDQTPPPPPRLGQAGWVLARPLTPRGLTFMAVRSGEAFVTVTGELASRQLLHFPWGPQTLEECSAPLPACHWRP